MDYLASISHHRESISSNAESLRSSSVFQKSYYRTHNDKKISIDRRVFNKLMTFLKNVVKDLGVGLVDIDMIEEYVQTEENYNKSEATGSKYGQSNLQEDVLYLINQEKSGEERIKELSDEIERFRSQCEDYKNENLSLKQKNELLEKKLEVVNIRLETANQDKQEFQAEMDRLKAEIEITKIENYNNAEEDGKAENIKNDAQDETNTHSIDQKQATELNILSNLPKVFQEDKILFSITDYLTPKEFFSFYHSSKSLQHIFHKNNYNVNNLKKAIELKKNEIIACKFYDWCKEYEVNDSEIERLIREYIQFNHLAGLELKNMLVKSLSYIDKDIKGPLGLTANIDNNEKKNKSLFGSLNNYFNKIIKKKDDQNIQGKRRSTLNSQNGVGTLYENINDYDKFLVTDNLVNNELNVEFDFHSADDIKSLLVQFFTSLKNSPQTISNFISELINEYSEFIFYAQRTLVEIKELDIVKNAMHERFKKYYKISLELENEIEDLKKFSKTNKEIKEILLKQKQEIEVKYTDSITQITFYKDELNKTSNKLMSITEKYNRIENEYESFKSKLVKEFKILKNEYDNVLNERGILLGAILEFKKYFLRFHITEDGDIAYVETD